MQWKYQLLANVVQYGGRTVDEFETDYKWMAQQLLENGGLKLDKNLNIKVSPS